MIALCARAGQNGGWYSRKAAGDLKLRATMPRLATASIVFMLAATALASIAPADGAAPEMTYHRDTILGTGYPALNYGQSPSFNSMTCESQEAGNTCIDNRGGHYFRLARDNHELH
jgi:hypothetical protein